MRELWMNHCILDAAVWLLLLIVLAVGTARMLRLKRKERELGERLSDRIAGQAVASDRRHDS